MELSEAWSYLDEIYGKALAGGIIKSTSEAASLIAALQTLAEHLGKLAEYEERVSALEAAAKGPEPKSEDQHGHA